MHAAFLKCRTMLVKLGTILSSPKEVTGGTVQGSVLGVLDHNVVLNDLDSEIDRSTVYTAKFVDDLTVIDVIVSQPTISSRNLSYHTTQPPSVSGLPDS